MTPLGARLRRTVRTLPWLGLCALLGACGGSGPADAEGAAAVSQAELGKTETADAGELPAPAVPASGQPATTWSAAMPDVPSPSVVLVPRLKIKAEVDPLGLDPKSGELVPPLYGRAGWYKAGPEPGEPGRAVIAGHLDNAHGLDVFARLGEARPSDRIVVRLADGERLTFRVQRVALFPQSDFPTALVYGGARDRAEIRLITCGGPYDHERGRYQGNVIVFGRLAAAS